eukprot:g47757.t1
MCPFSLFTPTEAGQEVKHPEVMVFDVSDEQVNNQKKATIVCLAHGFFPGYVKFSWTTNGKEVTGKNVVTDIPAQDNSGHYSATSRLTVPATEWGQMEYSCKVTHYRKDGQELHWEKPISSRRVKRMQKQQILAKTTYILLISKSIVYMTTVSILLFKMKVIAE